MRTVVLAPLLLIASACSSPPTPPSVDAAQRRPANSAMATELQSCRSDLHNTGLQLDEATRLVASTRVYAARMAASRSAERPTGADGRGVVYTVLFAFGSTRVELPDEEARHLLRVVRGAPLIQLSARTDGTVPTLAEIRIARERSEAVRDWLVAAGVPGATIRPTWQPVGDHAAENSSTGGRSLNRRVEIEVYRAAPRAWAPDLAPHND